MVFKKFIFLALTLFCAQISLAEVSDKGELGFESQFFEEDNNDATNDHNFSLKSRYEIKYQHNNIQAKFSGFMRTDVDDKDRDIAVPEEIWIGFQKSDFIFKAGYQIINWSATEAFHPSDALNSRNFDSEAQNAEKIGELMALVKYTYGAGSFSFLYMPLFTAPHFAPSSSRLGFSGNISGSSNLTWIDKGNFQDSREVDQYGIVWSHNFDDVDININFLDHVDRNHPAFSVINNIVNIVYYKSRHYGLTYSQVSGSYLFKFEASYTDFDEELVNASGLVLTYKPKDHTEIAPGIEYSHSFTDGSEMTLLLEYQKYFDTKKNYAPFYLFDNDILLGARYAFNNISGSEIFFSVIKDIGGRDEYFYNLDYSRRLSSYWKWQTGLRIIDASYEKESTFDVPNGLEQIRDTDRFYMNLTRYF